MRKSIADGMLYHLVLNLDVYFQAGVLGELFEHMHANQLDLLQTS